MCSEMQTDISDRCQYCNAILNRAYYFCTVCATPYRDLREVISVEIPWPETESAAIKKRAPHAWPIFWTYALAIFVLALTKSLWGHGSESGASFLYLSSYLFAAITVVVGMIHWRSLKPQLKRPGLGSVETYVGIALLLPILLINFGYHGVLKQLIQGQTEANLGIGFSQQVLIIAILPAIAEEIAFRGLIQHWLQVAIAPWRAVLLTSALFAALHLSIFSAPYLFLLGLLLGWVKWKSNSIYPSMVLHFLHNIVVIVVMHMFLKGG